MKMSIISTGIQNVLFSSLKRDNLTKNKNILNIYTGHTKQHDYITARLMIIPLSPAVYVGWWYFFNNPIFPPVDLLNNKCVIILYAVDTLCNNNCRVMFCCHQTEFTHKYICIYTKHHIFFTFWRMCITLVLYLIYKYI